MYALQHNFPQRQVYLIYWKFRYLSKPSGHNLENGSTPMGKARTVTRERIIDCAVMLFSRHGYGNVPLYDIARESGADKATIVRNFGGIDGIYAAIAGRIAENHLDAEQLAFRLADDVPYEDGILILLLFFFDTLFERIHYLRLCFMEGANPCRGLDWPLPEEMQTFLAGYIKRSHVNLSQDSLEVPCSLLVNSVTKCVWQANHVEGHWTSTGTVREEFANTIRPHIDVCLATLLNE